MKTHRFFTFASALCLSSAAFAADSASIGVVNFATCITESKSGKKEQANMENIRQQMSTLIEGTEKELKEIAEKFENTDFLDSLSPKAEEDLKMKFQTLQEDHARYQNQFYQVLQHAQYQLVQNMSGKIAAAAANIAKENNLDYVINKEACFYIRSDLDFTPSVIAELDKSFDQENKNNKQLSDNSDEEFDLDEIAPESLAN